MLLSARSIAKDVVPLQARVRTRSLQMETPAAVFQENPTASSSESFLHEEDSRARGGCQWQGLVLLHRPGPPASSSVWGLGHQQQLRFGSDGCLRSLKPLPPDGGLASVDGILRPAPKGEDRRRGISFDFLICSFSDTILAMQHGSFMEIRTRKTIKMTGTVCLVT